MCDTIAPSPSQAIPSASRVGLGDDAVELCHVGQCAHVWKLAFVENVHEGRPMMAIEHLADVASVAGRIDLNTVGSYKVDHLREVARPFPHTTTPITTPRILNGAI